VAHVFSLANNDGCNTAWAAFALPWCEHGVMMTGVINAINAKHRNTAMMVMMMGSAPAEVLA